jgi:hypothetical protein
MSVVERLEDVDVLTTFFVGALNMPQAAIASPGLCKTIDSFRQNMDDF